MHAVVDFLYVYRGDLFWIALMGIPFIWLAEVLGLWPRWQSAIEEKWHVLRK